MEAPATPGLANSDLQHGDVQRLEAAQRAAPRQKQQNASGQAAPAQGGQARRSKPPMEIPDAIDFISGRGGGTLDPANIGAGGGESAAAWQPFMRELARDATTSGALTTQIFAQLGNLSRAPNESFVEIVDQNAAEDAIRLSIQ